MASLPIIRRFLTEDFPSQASWIGQLFYPLNLLLNTIYSALSNGLTIGQNMLAQTASFSISASSPTVSFPYKFSPQLPLAVTVSAATGASQAAAIGCTWAYSGGTITVTVQGLAKGTTANLVFIVWGG